MKTSTMKQLAKALRRTKAGRRILSLVLTLAILFCLIPTVIYAEIAEAAEGSDTDNTGITMTVQESRWI